MTFEGSRGRRRRLRSGEMSEGRDPAIKLFGRKIPLPDEQPPAEEKGVSDSAPAIEPTPEGEKDICKEKEDAEVANAMLGGPGELDHVKPLSSTGLSKSSEDGKKTSTETAKTSEKPNPEQDHKEADTLCEDKILKKPDKILPCPRCNSMDTKFCYYNNYNVNQPRHFCKNCQRYWTAGGTMRNVPVGAGRRKNKHSVSGYHHTVVTSEEALESVQVDSPEITCHEALLCGSSAPKMLSKENDTLLKFGPDARLCGSMVSVLSLGEQNKTSELGFTPPTENREEPSCSSSVTASVPVENGFPKDAGQNAMNSYGDGIEPLHHLQCYTLPPLAYAWSPGWDNVAAAAAAAAMQAAVCSLEPVPGKGNGVLPPISWNQPPVMTAPAFCAPTLPFPFVPASFWGCMPSWTSGPWNLPWVGNNSPFSPPSTTSTSNCSGNGSPTLGKHSRDATLPGEEKTERSLWVPKTLRIDDPDEAARSSIFATLGIKPDECGMFKAFPPKAGKGKASDVTQVLRSNPAALSRSQSFRETT